MKTMIMTPVLLGLLAVGAGAQLPETALTGRVTDYVPDEEGVRPGILGVEVEARDPESGEVLSTSHTNPAGEYLLTGLVANRRLEIEHHKTGYVNYPTTVKVVLLEGVKNELPEEVHLMPADLSQSYLSRLLVTVVDAAGQGGEGLETELSYLKSFALPQEERNWLLRGLGDRYGSEVVAAYANTPEEPREHVYSPPRDFERGGGGGGGYRADSVVLAPEP